MSRPTRLSITDYTVVDPETEKNKGEPLLRVYHYVCGDRDPSRYRSLTNPFDYCICRLRLILNATRLSVLQREGNNSHVLPPSILSFTRIIIVIDITFQLKSHNLT